MKIGFFITIRLKSTRLRKKVILPLHNKKVVDLVIERAKKVTGIDGVVMCTSVNKQDSELYEYALKHNIQFYPGSEDDVLRRLYNAAEYYGYDALVSITADNPLFSIYISELFINKYKQHSFDYIYSSGLPIGISPYFISKKALRVINFIKPINDTEIWGSFLNQPNFFKVCEIKYNSPFNEKVRITLDYKEDYDLLKKIYEKFSISETPTTSQVFKIILQNPNFLKINNKKTQIKLSKKRQAEIDNLIVLNKNKIDKYIKKNNLFFSPEKYSLNEFIYL